MRTPLLRLLAGVSMLALFVAGCGPTVAASSAATVNGTTISRSQLEDAVRELVGDVEELSAEEREQQVGTNQRQILTMLITSHILEEAAQAQGVEVTDDDLQSVRDEVLEAVGGEDELDAALEGAGLTRELFEEVYLSQQAHLTVLREQLVGDQTLETRTVRHILVETQEEADDLVAQLDDGGDFAELAMEHSLDPQSGEAGGDLGPAPPGSYVPEFEEAAWGSEIGEVVGPIETQFGFHIIEVTDEGATSADELAPEQIDQLIGEDLQEILETAFEEAEITIGTGLGVWDETQRQVVSEDEVGDEPPAEDGVPPTDDGAPPTEDEEPPAEEQ